MNAPALTLERFRSLAEAYGGALERWPEEWQAAAEALCAGNPQARAILAAERELDGLVALRPAPRPAPGALVARLVEAAPGQSRRGLAAWLADLWPGEARWAAPVVLSLALLAGVTLGGNLSWDPFQDVQAAQQQIEDEDSLAGVLALGPSYEDFEL